MTKGQRIANLRKNKKISQSNLAKAIHVSPSTIGMWETEQRAIKDNDLVSLANFFDVTTDYLLGRVDGLHDDLVIAAHMDDNLTEQQIEEINKFIEFQKQEYIKDRDKKNGLKKD